MHGSIDPAAFRSAYLDANAVRLWNSKRDRSGWNMDDAAYLNTARTPNVLLETVAV